MTATRHVLCDGCWLVLWPRRTPYRVLGETKLEQCCRCRRFTDSGIYVRMQHDAWGACPPHS